MTRVRIILFESRTKRPVDKKAEGQKGRRTKKAGDGKAYLFDAPRTRRLDWADSNVECLLDRNAMNAYTSNYSYAINGDIRFYVQFFRTSPTFLPVKAAI